ATIGIVEELSAYPYFYGLGLCNADNQLAIGGRVLVSNCYEPLLNPGYKAGIAFAIMVLMLIWRPQGLFRGSQF
ncbi:MAG TPA: hypothetical protein VFJ13_05570, partial [Paracoccaceae bacterium]|nr:hypothetical protein [Paracoccaceae bacterium]